MAVRTNDLHAIPLFQGITEQHLHALLGAFETLTLHVIEEPSELEVDLRVPTTDRRVDQKPPWLWPW